MREFLCSGGRPAEAEISHKAEQSVKNTPFSLTAGGDNRYTLERLKPERRVLFHAQADYRCGFAAAGGAVYPAGLPSRRTRCRSRIITANPPPPAKGSRMPWMPSTSMFPSWGYRTPPPSGWPRILGWILPAFPPFTAATPMAGSALPMSSWWSKNQGEAFARDLLVTIRTSRAGLFANYDIYGATELAENGVIYTFGRLLCSADDKRHRPCAGAAGAVHPDIRVH